MANIGVLLVRRIATTLSGECGSGGFGSRLPSSPFTSRKVRIYASPVQRLDDKMTKKHPKKQRKRKVLNGR
jgi:hypothetical protein